MSLLNPYKYVVFEISGMCNARCPFCSTGSKYTKPGGFIGVDKFKRAIDRLLTLRLIDGETTIFLYNWGEPLLNPNWQELIQYLNLSDITYVISSNASVFKEFHQDLPSKMAELNFSIPGFSQASYDRIHGFDFEVIKRNISSYAANLKSIDYKGTMTILFHIYQFNLDEISKCLEFARSLQIYVHPYYAYIAHYDMAKQYITGTIGKDTLKSLSENLFCSEVKRKIIESPRDYACPQNDILTIDENADILTCCLLPNSHSEYSIGSVFGDVESVLSRKGKANECGFCLQSGLSYYFHTTPVPEFYREYESLVRQTG